MKKLLILSLIFFSCSFCTKEVSKELNYFADTWTSNAANQVVTAKAVLDGVTTGYLQAASGVPDTRKIYTKTDISTYELYIPSALGGVGIGSTFSTFASGEGITRADIESTIYPVESNSVGVLDIPNVGHLLYLPTNNLYSDIAVGKQLYTNRARTTTYSRGAAKWMYLSVIGSTIEVGTSGTILSINPL